MAHPQTDVLLVQTTWNFPRYVADMVRPKAGQGSAASAGAGGTQQPCTETLDPSVMKRMPVDLIARCGIAVVKMIYR